MNDLTQAKKLIKDCQDTQNPYLDLGKCGITNLNELPELFECKHIETLILSNSWWDCAEKKQYISNNKGEYNILFTIPKEISNLEKLTKLIICGDEGGNWQISDFSFLEKLTNLQYLNLSYNHIYDIIITQITDFDGCVIDLIKHQISDISFLGKLTNLQHLYLAGSNIYDFSFIKNLTSLQYLDLSDNDIHGCGFLENLTSLLYVDLRCNDISDFRFLKKLPNLQDFDQNPE